MIIRICDYCGKSSKEINVNEITISHNDYIFKRDLCFHCAVNFLSLSSNWFDSKKEVNND